jgi:hypothetical protein
MKHPKRYGTYQCKNRSDQFRVLEWNPGTPGSETIQTIKIDSIPNTNFAKHIQKMPSYYENQYVSAKIAVLVHKGRLRMDPYHCGDLDPHPYQHPHQIKIRIRIK